MLPLFIVQTIAFLAWLRYSKGIKVEPQEPQVIDLDGESESEEKEVVMLDDDDDKKTENGDNTDESTYVRPHLIVVPASTLTNWEREFEKFCPHLHVIKYHGSMMEREELREQLRKYLPRRGEDAKPNAFRVDVILTTFSYFSGEKTDDRAFLKRFDFDYLVVDEAHCLKNARGQRYRNLDKVQTSHRLLLTGKHFASSYIVAGFDLLHLPKTHLARNYDYRNSCAEFTEGAHVALELSHASILQEQWRWV